MKFLKYSLLTLAALALYAVSAIPVGLFLYSLKMDMGINLFSSTGFHSYLSCLQEEARKAEAEESEKAAR